MKTGTTSSTHNVKDTKGFTLVETLMALFLFSFGIIAVMSLTSNSMAGFTAARATSREVNRVALQLESLKETGYRDTAIFRAGTWNPEGTDGVSVSYTNADDAVVFETKLIMMQNNAVRHGISPSGNFELYFTKPLIE